MAGKRRVFGAAFQAKVALAAAKGDRTTAWVRMSRPGGTRLAERSNVWPGRITRLLRRLASASAALPATPG